MCEVCTTVAQSTPMVGPILCAVVSAFGVLVFKIRNLFKKKVKK